jgi:ATP-dependent DNA helicase RecG
MPPGRQKISTFLIPAEKREKAYRFIAKEVKNGRQIFVICPLIEESDKLGVKSVEAEYRKLKDQIFPQFKIGLLHGKMKAKEKEKIMADFKKGKLDILVSTPVVEVGIDVPNASVMMIEGADRFGLAQLHQFRGRVGRGKHKSYCFLFSDSNSSKTLARLKAMEKMNDGFKLAEKDLRLRGPGEIYGLHQHGFPDLKMASLFDIKTLKIARQAAEKIIKTGIEKYSNLKNKLLEYQKERRLE